ncbi:arginine repressor [Bifidobacterium pullorum]|uniref:arginine repressor n=1 Tax=Bifidobacterium pullorum TaxID=78448 RepID=UPI000529EBC9|nr:arginine repressor [Bifidobacterium pullorum]HJE21079.1 arginine repressor [Bifidobacterium pullorum]
MSETNPLQRPATRAARLSAVEEALLKYVITSQSQLSQILADEDIDVTQATLSRDLDELGAVKTRLADGTVAYTIDRRQQEPASHAGAKAEQQMSRILSGLVTSVASANNLIVVHTPSGAAQYVASVIDRQPLDGVLGTIAGDDTVMIVCSDERTASDRSRWLLDIASKTVSGE